MIRVVNKYTHQSTRFDTYIGRGSPLGNPYTSQNLSETIAEFQASSREDSIEKFKYYLEDKIKEKDANICAELNRIYQQALKTDVYLVCFCKPKQCHGDIIRKIIESKLNENI